MCSYESTCIDFQNKLRTKNWRSTKPRKSPSKLIRSDVRTENRMHLWQPRLCLTVFQRGTNVVQTIINIYFSKDSIPNS